MSWLDLFFPNLGDFVKKEKTPETLACNRCSYVLGTVLGIEKLIREGTYPICPKCRFCYKCENCKTIGKDFNANFCEKCGKSLYRT